MKISKTVLSLITIALTLTVTAQTKVGKKNNSLKESYIQQQGYLSTTGGLALHSPYGDSLRGFDEKGLTQYYMGIGLGGSELIGHIENLKRKYIKEKFNLNTPVVPATPAPVITAQGKKKGGSSTINVAPCVNEGFEQNSPGAYTSATAVTGWTVDSRSANSTCSFTDWAAGSSEFSLIATPLSNWPNSSSPITFIPHSPLGGTVVAQLNDDINDNNMTRIRQTFPVLSANALFQFAYAGYWQDGGSGHGCCDQPGINMKMFDCNGNPLVCASMSLFPGSGCQSTGTTFTLDGNVGSWTNWQVKSIDFTPYIGTCITVEFMTTDCSFGGHWGTTLLDVMCGGQNIGTNLPPAPGGNIGGPVSFCSGSNVAVINAPSGYALYQWISPLTGTTIPASQGGTATALTINNPIPGLVYTVMVTTATGCLYTATLALAYSAVQVGGIGAAPSCPNGSSGSATVAGNGSGAGYTYTWTNASNSVIGTSSLVTGLAPGTYTVRIGGLGAAGCGTAISWVTVGAVPTQTQSIFRPYCSAPAYLPTSGGTNYQWYQGTTPITGSLGTLPNYTVTNPSNGAQYWVSYNTAQGCRDSIRFTLAQSSYGSMTVPTNSIKVICPGASNGTAAVVMVPASGAPVGFSTFSVSSTGTTAPYSASLGPTSSSVFAFSGLSQGSYTVQTFDGSCRYSTNFVITPYVYNYTVTPGTATLCPGNSIPAAINFSSTQLPGTYSYTWTPTNWLVGGNGNVQQTLITPTGIPKGSVVTTVYTINVRPAVANCVVTKTIAITAVNPPTPTITPIQPLCNTSQPYQIIATPGGGTFINTVSNPTLIGVSSGIINPAGATQAINHFTYAINVNTCIATQVDSFQVSTFYTSALTSTIAPKCVTDAPINLMNIVQQTSGTWTTHPGQTVPAGALTGNVFNPSAFTGITGSVTFTVDYKTYSMPNPNTCSSTTSQTIAITNTFVPYVIPIQPFCTNFAPISMSVTTPGAQGGTWSGPNISANGVITPSTIVQPGNNTVTYSVQSGPCVNFVNSTFMVHKFNPATLTSGIPEQCAISGLPYNLMSIVQNTNGSWAGPGIVPGSKLFDPTQISATSVPQLTYMTVSTPPGGPCDDMSTINVSVLRPIAPTIAQVGPYCSKDAGVQLMVSPDEGAWTPSTFLSPNGIFTPSNAAIGNNVVEYVVGTPTCMANSTKVISVEAFVSSYISAQHLPNLCNNGAAINLMPYTANTSGTWYGPGINGTNFNPTLAGKGDWILTYTTASIPSGLCPDQSTVAVSVFSLQTPNIAPAGPFCTANSPVQLTSDVQGGMFTGANTGAVNMQGLFIPASAVIGDNVVNYSVTSGPCVAYAQTTISVEQFVSADFHTIPPVFCNTNEPVNLNSYVVNPGGYWNGTGVNGNMFDPRLANPNNNNEITYYTYSTPHKTLCPDERKIRIEVVELPALSIVANKYVGCAPFEVFLNTPNVTTGDVEWVLGDKEERVTGEYVINHVYTTAGVYTVQMNYNLKGCKTQVFLDKAITVNEKPVADFTIPEEVLISDPQIELVNTSTPLAGNTYNWKVDGFADRNELHPAYTLPKIGRYVVTLTATDKETGCFDEETKTIEVKNDFNIYIPTSFSPNFDGLNDKFKPVFSPYGLDTKSFEMEIFDRWGHSIYFTNDFTKGWDGSVGNKGEPLKEGVYIFKIRYKDLDGNSYSKMGHVTMLK
jgi:gliding motility-associated-like protein